MSGYVPKVGDKVRATLGDNVLVGEVIDEYAGDLIEIMVSEDECLTLDRNSWHFEQIVSVPTKFGAVIRRADDERFVLFAPNSADNRSWSDAWGGFVRTEHATRSGFTVLFEGVDE